MKIAMLGLRAIGQGQGDQEGGGGRPFLDLFSGIERAVEEITTRLAARGHDVTVFCRARYNPGPLREFRGVHLRNQPAIYTKHLEAISHTFLASLHTLRGFDVVHFHATGPSLCAFVPRLAGRKVVVTVHGLDWQREKWRGFAKVALRAGAWTAGGFAHRTIVVSRALQDYYRETYRRETVFIPAGCNTSPQHVPADALRRFGVSGGDYILFLSRLVPEKGCDLLIRAFSRLDTDKKLLIVGGSSYTDEYVSGLKRLAAGHPRIVFTGYLTSPERDAAYSNAALLVLPSTLEGMPMVLLEAMSYGCPVLASDIPYNLEVVAPKDAAQPTGFSFRSRSEDDLVARLQRCLESPAELRAAAERAKAYIRDRYSWDRIAEETERVYLSLAR